MRRQAIFHARVIDADLGVFGGQVMRHFAAQRAARAIGITVYQVAHHIGDVFLRTAQPVLQHEKVSTHVLGSTRDEFQELRQAAQHFHLLRAGGAAGFGIFFAAQALEQGHRAGAGLGHIKAAHAR